MSKIVSAINAMISHKTAISNVIQGENPQELYFLYDSKHKWSISKDHENNLYLHYYSGDESLEELTEVINWADLKTMISYSSADLGTREALESLKELYSIVKEKLLGMDDVLDDIINGIPF